MSWDAFLNLKEGPAMIIAALITIIGAGIGILLGSRLFGGKVKDDFRAFHQPIEAIDTPNISLNGRYLKAFQARECRAIEHLKRMPFCQ